MPARAIPSKGDFVSHNAKPLGILMDEIGSSLRIVMSGRENMLGGETILYGDNPAAAVKSQLP